MTSLDQRDWMLADDGQCLPQTSGPAVIDAMLDLLDLRRGQRVLEIGTGSSWSTANISHAICPGGRVVSLDVDAELVTRARRLHQQAGHSNVQIELAEGHIGWPDARPYDRIIAWATPHVLPRTWVEQAAREAVIVTSVKLAAVALANAVLRCHVTDGQPRKLTLHPGSMIEMHRDVLTEFRLPVRYVDAARHTPVGPSWISGAMLHDHPATAADQLLQALAPTDALPSRDSTSRDAFKAWLLATHQEHLATAGDPDGWGFGLATRDSAAILRPDGVTLHAGTKDMLQRLDQALRTWEQADRPDFSALTAHAQPTADGWTIRAHWQKPSRSHPPSRQ